MADSMLPSKIQEDFQEQFLTCSLCTEPYNTTDHQAKFLPCLHSFCKSCLQKRSGNHPKIDCPNCRIEVTLTDGTIDSLPNNFIVENLKEFEKIFSLSVVCGSCDEEYKAVGFCHDCGCFLCQRCVDNHQTMRPLRHHKLSTMTDLQEKKFNPMMQQQRCKIHPNQDLTLYCMEAKCKVPVCASCGLVDHRGHDLIDLTAAIDDIITKMRQSSSKLKRRHQELTKKAAKVDSMQETLTETFNKKEKEIQDSVQKLHSLIDSRYNNALSHLKHMYETEMTWLTKNTENRASLTAQMITACEFADKVCDVSQPMQLLTSQGQIMSRLNELENSKLPDPTATKKTITFTDEHMSLLTRIETSLQHLWDVHWFVASKRGPDQNMIRLKQQRDEFIGIVTKSASQCTLL